MKVPKVLKTDNGVLCLLYNSRDLITSNILVLVKTGTDYEEKDLNGISHFIEHLFFKGTLNFPSSKDLSLELDKIGADYNAFTSYEYTGYYIKTLNNYLERAFFLIADMLSNPLFDETELEKERNVIFEEINFHYDTPTSFIFDEVIKLAYGDQPAGWPILGTKETLSKIKRETIFDYFKNHYSKKNTLVIISGNFEEKKVIRWIEKYFNNYSNHKTAIKKNTETYLTPRKINVIKRENLKQSHLVFLFKTEGFKKLKNRRFILEIIKSILGYGFSSRMFRILREELGVTYYLKVDNDFYTDRGYLYIQTASTLDKINLTIDKIIEEINNLKNNVVKNEELEKARSMILSSLFSNLETSLSLSFFYGFNYLLLGKIHTVDDYKKFFYKISVKDIKEEANKIFNKNNLVFGILCPYDLDLKNLNKIFDKI
jgi:predicted Zn-dependent peptidase